QSLFVDPALHQHDLVRVPRRDVPVDVDAGSAIRRPGVDDVGAVEEAYVRARAILRSALQADAVGMEQDPAGRVLRAGERAIGIPAFEELSRLRPRSPGELSEADVNGAVRIRRPRAGEKLSAVDHDPLA